MRQLKLKTPKLHFGDASDTVSAIRGLTSSVLGGADAKLIIKSNVTPDITVNLADILQPGANGPKPNSISSDNEQSLSYIKPEIQIRGFGVKYDYAPYGKPSKEIFILFAILIALSIYTGITISWKMCRALSKKSSGK